MADRMTASDDPKLLVFGTRIEGAQYHYRPSAYAVVRNDKGEFAAAETPHACFLIGGGINPGESADETIRREALEECGLHLVVRSQIGRAMQICYSVADDAYYEKDSTFMEADVQGSTVALEHDHRLLWLSAPEALTRLSHESHRWAVESFLNQM